MTMRRRQGCGWSGRPSRTRKQKIRRACSVPPTEASAAEEFAGALSALDAAYLVSTPGTLNEVLLPDDAPDAHAKQAQSVQPNEVPGQIHSPEWDWRAGAYHDPGVTAFLLPAASAPQQLVDDTLASRRGMLHKIRRRFELL